MGKFPYISRIHTADMTVRIPPFGWYLKCLVIIGDLGNPGAPGMEVVYLTRAS